MSYECYLLKIQTRNIRKKPKYENFVIFSNLQVENVDRVLASQAKGEAGRYHRNEGSEDRNRSEVHNRRAVAQVTAAKAHEHFLVLPHGVVAAFLVVRRASLQARALRGRVKLLFLGVRVARLYDLAAPAGRARHGLHIDARICTDLRHVRVLEAILAAAQFTARPAAKATLNHGVGWADDQRTKHQCQRHRPRPLVATAVARIPPAVSHGVTP